MRKAAHSLKAGSDGFGSSLSVRWVLVVAAAALCFLGGVAFMTGETMTEVAEAVPESLLTDEAPGSDETGGVVEVPQAPEEIPSEDVDVVVYATQTSGLAAVRELVVAAPHLQVALISCGNLFETPLAQGLSVEDARDIGRVTGGFYTEWRNAVITAYGVRGIRPFTSSGRFVYEPEMAVQALWALIGGKSSPNVTFYSAHLVAASDQGEERYVDVKVEGAGPLRLNTRYFIDASVEGDLARMLGASYRIGRHEAVYNDIAGPTPAYPSGENGYETAPQRFSPLLTLRVYPTGRAPRIADLVHHNYDPTTFAALPGFAQKNVDAFGASWTMRIAVLPNGKRELNESWNDWPDVGLSFQWVFAPEKRGDIRRRVLEWAINRVRYLQENGYSRVGIAAIPQKLYVREGPRIVGLDTYTVTDLRAGILRDPVAVGCYVEYDRHDAFFPNHIEDTRYIYVPMRALMAEGHPALLVSTAVSTDFATYNSAVRMEHGRANMGGAAGAMIVIADRLGVEPHEVPYDQVRSELLGRGFQVGPIG